MQTRKGSRILGIALALCIVVSALCGLSLTASAEYDTVTFEFTDYLSDIYGGGGGVDAASWSTETDGTDKYLRFNCQNWADLISTPARLSLCDTGKPNWNWSDKVGFTPGARYDITVKYRYAKAMDREDKILDVKLTLLKDGSVSNYSASYDQLLFSLSPSEASNTWQEKTIRVALPAEFDGDASQSNLAIVLTTQSDGGWAGNFFFDITSVKVDRVQEQCAHANKTDVAEQASTCSEKGWDAYKKCADCGQIFSADGGTELIEPPYRGLADHTYGNLQAKVEAEHDASGMEVHYVCSVCGKYFTADKAETTREELIIPAIPHDFGTEWVSDAANHWHACECGAKQDETAHTFEWVVDTPASEGTAGVKHEECTVCKLKRNENTAIESLPHTLIHVEAVAATHDAAGNTEYWHCESCGKYYSDAEGTTEIEQADTVIAQIPHSFGEEWESDANNHWHACECGAKQDEAAHTFEWKVDQEATATEKGSKHEECKVCGYKKTAVEIPATGSSTSSEVIKPTVPTDTTNPTDTEPPKTGESSQTILLLSLLLISGAGVCLTTLVSKKKSY